MLREADSAVHRSVATEDVTMQRCVDDDECHKRRGCRSSTRVEAVLLAGDTSEEIAEAYIGKVKDQFPASAKIYEIPGGNHEQYGSYGSPSYSKGLAYKDLVAKISAEDQCEQVAKALAETASW